MKEPFIIVTGPLWAWWLQHRHIDYINALRNISDPYQSMATWVMPSNHHMAVVAIKGLKQHFITNNLKPYICSPIQLFFWMPRYMYVHVCHTHLYYWNALWDWIWQWFGYNKYTGDCSVLGDLEFKFIYRIQGNFRGIKFSCFWNCDDIP